jgi:predicted phosphodiesterase
VDGYEESGFPTEAIIKLNGFRIAIRHVVFEAGKLTNEGRAFLDRTRPDICIFGHTHQPRNEWLDGTLLFNAGSAGPKRFRIQRGIGVIVIKNGFIEPTLIALNGRVNSESPVSVIKEEK